jgi:hypothetical protein
MNLDNRLCRFVTFEKAANQADTGYLNRCAFLLTMNWLLEFFLYIVVPTAIALVVSLPIWLSKRIILGNVIGSGIIAVIMIFWIVVVFAEAFANPAQLQDPPLTRMIIIGVLGWVDVFILLIFSGRTEDYLRKKSINPDMF